MAMTDKQRRARISDLDTKILRYRHNWHLHLKDKNPARARYWLGLLKTVKKQRAYQVSKLGPTGIGPNGVLGIEANEGFSALPYWDDIGKKWTNGFGNTNGVTAHTAAVTREQASAYVVSKANSTYLAPLFALAQKYGVKLKQREVDALASLLWNCGPGILTPGHSMHDAIASGSRRRMVAAFRVYVYSGRELVPGLVTRREREIRMFKGK